MIWTLLLLLTAISSAYATAEPLCPGGSAVAHFRLQVQRPGESRWLALETLHALKKNDTVSYVPSDPLPGEDQSKAEVVLLLAPQEGQALIVLERKPALGRQRWKMPVDVAVVAVAYGPNGWRGDRLEKLLRRDPEMLTQLAAYGARTNQVEELVDAMARRDPQNMEAALRGLAAGGAGGARLDRNATVDQQTLTMMRTLNPALATYDPLAAEPKVRWQQSAGLAAAVAGLFLGNTVAVAATSATLFLNLRTVAFPRTEFRSALRREGALCGKPGAGSGVRFAYLWARRLPSGAVPELEMTEAGHWAIGMPGKVAFAGGTAELGQMQSWRWVDAAGETMPVVGAVREGILHVTKAPPPGTYSLAGDWDWEPVRSTAVVTVYAWPEWVAMGLDAASADALQAGKGRVRLRLTGSDFQFVTRVEIATMTDRLAEAVVARFVAAKGPVRELEIEVDTDRVREGAHRISLTRVDGATHSFAAMVHGELPSLAGLPMVVRQNGEAQRLRLTGERLGEVERWEVAGGTVEWARERQEVILRLSPGIATNTTERQLTAWIGGRNLPLRWANAVRVLPAAVSVVAVQRAAREIGSVELTDSEVEAEELVSVAVRLSGPLAAGPPRTVRCGTMERTEQTGPAEWFLVVRPEAKPGCVVAVELEPGGAEVALGRVIRRPDLTGFVMTEESAGAGRFWGELSGKFLERIERVGWNGQEGVAVVELPTGGGHKLRIEVPWPAPTPHAPLYVWLRGESSGRKTRLKL